MQKKYGRSRLRKAFNIRGDSEEITGLKEALRDFIAEFGVCIFGPNVELC